MGLWWHWLLATSAGLGIGLLLLIPSLQAGPYIHLPWFPFPILDLSGVVGMGLTGFFQALVIRPHFTTWKRWILATLAAWFVFLILLTYGSYVFPLNLFSRLGYYGPLIGGNSVTGIELGLVIGFFQWFVLRGQVEDASWWIPINVIAYAFAVPIAAEIGSFSNVGGSANYNQSFASSLVLLTSEAGIICGIVAGAISGLGLIWLLHWRIANTPP